MDRVRPLGPHAAARRTKRPRACTSALAIREKALGDAHPAVAASLDNLAEVHAYRGAHAQAEDLLAQSLAIRETTLGRPHPEVAATHLALARLSLARSDPADAAGQAERAVELFGAKGRPPSRPTSPTRRRPRVDRRRERGGPLAGQARPPPLTLVMRRSTRSRCRPRSRIPTCPSCCCPTSWIPDVLPPDVLPLDVLPPDVLEVLPPDETDPDAPELSAHVVPPAAIQPRSVGRRRWAIGLLPMARCKR